MDPNETLRQQCSMAARLMAAIDEGRPIATDDVERLCELVQAMDQWLAKGGFLPGRWERSAPQFPPKA